MLPNKLIRLPAGGKRVLGPAYVDHKTGVVVLPYEAPLGRVLYGFFVVDRDEDDDTERGGVLRPATDAEIAERATGRTEHLVRMGERLAERHRADTAIDYHIARGTTVRSN